MDDSEMSDGYPDADYDSDNPYHGNMYGRTTTARAPARTLGDAAAGGPIPLFGPQSSAGRRVRNPGSPDGGRAGRYVLHPSQGTVPGSTAVLC